MTPLYTASATAHGGRTGHVRTSDGALDLALAMPVALGGPGGDGTNPEQLFASAYAACFEGALRLVARTRKQNIDNASVAAHVTIARGDDGGLKLAVELEASVPGHSHEDALALMHAAHQVCPYSNATRGNIDVTLNVID